MPGFQPSGNSRLLCRSVAAFTPAFIDELVTKGNIGKCLADCHAPGKSVQKRLELNLSAICCDRLPQAQLLETRTGAGLGRSI